MQVYKFGGASVKDPEAVRNVVKILKNYVNQKTIVVVSAMGKTTNMLEEVATAYFKRENPINNLEKVKDFHYEILKSLFSNHSHQIFNEIENTFVEVNWIIDEEPIENYNQIYDQIVSIGEIVSSKIISAYLTESEIDNAWLDIRGIIQTDNNYREGNVDYELSQNLVSSQLMNYFKSKNLIITQGFIGGTSENFTTTLGREGSDYTAALLAYFTNAEKVTIWKDVAGVLNADPKYFSNTKKIDELSYYDAIELTYYGATVIHPKTIKPLQNKNIPLFVKSFLEPEKEGTKIHDSGVRLSIPGFIFKVNQLLISIQPKDFSFIAEENLSKIFEAFAKYQVKINLMQNSAINFSVCVDYDADKISSLLENLQKDYKILFNENVELLTIRNYDQKTLDKLIENKGILLEVKTRNTAQIVMSKI